MNKKNKRLTFLLALPVLFLVVTGVYFFGVWQARRLNTSLHFPPAKSDMIARFPLADDCTFISMSGQKVNFDMGSRHSFIRRNAVEVLRANRYPISESRVALVTTDPDGRYRLYTRKITLNVKLPNPEMPDSGYYIHNVELLVGDGPNDNVIGMDILRYLVLEHTYDGDEIRLYRSVPENYVTVSDITLHNSPLGNVLAPSRRASIELAVNDDAPRDYFFDTGGKMRALELVQPESQMHNATTGVERDPATGLMLQKHCRVVFGDRLRYSNVVYSDTLHTDDYSVNPLNLFDQDCVIDFPGHRLLTHKTAD